MKHEFRVDDSRVIVSLCGELDLEKSASLRAVLHEALPKGDSIIIDMSGAKLIDSSGIASLLEAFHYARKKNKQFILASPNQRVMRVFNLAKLENVFDIAENLEKAMEKIRSQTA